MNTDIENLIIKFLVNEANLDELQELELWINNPENEALFHEYIKTNTYVNRAISSYDIKSAKKTIINRIRKEKSVLNRKTKTYNLYKYAAAVVVGILATTYFFKNSLFTDTIETNSEVVNVNTILPGVNKATLTLQNGSVVELDKGSAYNTKNVSSNGEQIVYKVNESHSAQIEFNYLTIPRGGQFFIILSDGTKVWLNSESQLKYPVNFIDGKTRQVELVYGEAYFEVSSHTNHNGARFKVLNQHQEIEVLGTKFNIKAYKDETNVYTTLVEGKVAIGKDNLKQNLEPNQQSNLNIKTNNITVLKVDVSSEISWKDGVFRFVDKPLKDIMKVVSRWYDVDIVFENKELESVQFLGVISKKQSFQEILAIMKSTSINNYEINGKTIILK